MTTSQIVVVMVSVIIGAVLKSTSGIGMPFVTIPAISYVACVPALATIPLGSRIRTGLSSAAFDQVVLAMLVFSAIGLAWRTFA